MKIYLWKMENQMNEIKYGTEQRIQYVYGRGQNLAVLIRRNTTL